MHIFVPDMTQADGDVVGQRLLRVLGVGHDGRVVCGVLLDIGGQIGFDLLFAPGLVAGAGLRGVVLADHVLVGLLGLSFAPGLHAQPSVVLVTHGRLAARVAQGGVGGLALVLSVFLGKRPVARVRIVGLVLAVLVAQLAGGIIRLVEFF